MPPTDVLLQILTIIHYPDDKQQFLDKFSLFALERTAVRLLKTLPEDKAKDAYAKLHKKEGEDLIKELKAIFSEEAYVKMLNASIKVLLLDYVKTIRPKLNVEEKKHLDGYLKTLVK